MHLKHGHKIILMVQPATHENERLSFYNHNHGPKVCVCVCVCVHHRTVKYKRMLFLISLKGHKSRFQNKTILIKESGLKRDLCSIPDSILCDFNFYL